MLGKKDQILPEKLVLQAVNLSKAMITGQRNHNYKYPGVCQPLPSDQSHSINLFPHEPHTIFRLPPHLKAVWSKCSDHIFNEMTVRIEGLIVRIL